MKKPQCVFYAKNSGVEVAPSERRSDGRPAEGRVVLRFFRLEEGAAAIRFMMEPWESFDLSRKIGLVQEGGGKEKLTHRFEGNDGEVLTTLTVGKVGAQRQVRLRHLRAAGQGGDQRAAGRRPFPVRSRVSQASFHCTGLGGYW